MVYTLDTSENWCDVYIKIPLLNSGNYVIYLTYADGTELAGMAGVDDSNMQTFETGKWHSSANDTWVETELSSGNLTSGIEYKIIARDDADFTADGAPDNDVGTVFVATGTSVTLDSGDKVVATGQTVFQSEMVKSSQVIDNAPFDFQDEEVRMPNLVNEPNDAVLLNATFVSTEIAAIPDLGSSFLVGSGQVNMSSNQGIIHFGGVGTISAQANGGSGLVNHTDAGHTLKVDEIVEITGTTSYNGTFEVINVYVDSFDLEQTWVANDATGQWRRGYHPFPDKGYIFTRVKYAGSDVAADVFVFGINKETSLRLDIDFSVPAWEVDDSGAPTDFTKLSAPQVSSGTGIYFLLLSWDKSSGTVSFFVYDVSTGTFEAEEITYAVSSDESCNFRIGDISGSSKAIASADFSQCQFGGGRYFDATVIADINAVRNIANFRPAFENVIGESLGADNVDDGTMDVTVLASVTGTNWTTDADWTVNSGTANKAHCTAAGASDLRQSVNNIVAGITYLVKCTVSGIAAGGVSVRVGGVLGTNRTANGTYVQVITAVSAEALRFRSPAGGFTGDIDDFTCYPLTFNNNVDYSSAIKAITLNEQGNLLKWSPVNGIAFPDLNFKFLREPVEAIIPSPSFLQFNYENTFVIFMRNFVNRFVLDGDPSLLASRSDVLIEEKTSYGLQYANSLARAGESLFWKSEAGIIHWSTEGLLLISDGVISIADIGGSGDMYGFYSPIRNQYLLHNKGLNTYVYHLKWKVFTRFTGILMKSKPVTLTAGLAADNVNIFLDTSSNVDKYPGSTDTTAAAEIRTKEFLMGKGLLDKILGAYSELAGTILSVVVKNVDYAGGEKETTLTKEPLVWRHVDLAKKRGRSFYIKLKNVTDFSYFRIKYRNIGGAD